MALSAKVISFNKSGSTGTQTVTGVGFPGKVVLLWSTKQSAVGATTGAVLTMGMSDGTRQIVRGINHPGGEAATTSSQWEHRTLVLLFADTSDPTPTVLASASFGAFNNDGFTLSWGVNDGGTELVHALVLGGQIDVELVQFQVSTTTIGGTVDYTDLAFRPECFITLTGAVGEFTGTGDYTNPAPFGSIAGFGFSNGSENVCAWTLGRGTGGAADNYRGAHTDRCISERETVASGAADLCGGQITAILDNGFTFTRTQSSSGVTPVQSVICIRGARFALGSFSAPTSDGGTHTLTPDFLPRAAIVETVDTTAEGNTANMALSFGAWDGTDEGGIWIGGVDTSNPSVYRRALSSHLLEVRDRSTGSLTAQADVTSSGLGELEITFSDAPASAITVLYIVLGDSEDPDEPEFVDGEVSQPLTRIDITLRDDTTKSFAEVDLNDREGYTPAGYKPGWVLRFLPISRGLSDRMGQLQHLSFGAILSDTARYFRGLLDGVTTKYLTNRPLAEWMIDDENRRQEDLWRLAAAGFVSDYTTEQDFRFRIEGTDWLKKKFSRKSTASRSWQPLITEDDFPSAGATIHTSEGSPIEVAAVGKSVPIIYGKVSDSRAGDVTVSATRLPFDADIDKPSQTLCNDKTGVGGTFTGRVFSIVTGIKTIGGIKTEGPRSSIQGTLWEVPHAVVTRWNGSDADVDSWRIYFFNRSDFNYRGAIGSSTFVRYFEIPNSPNSSGIREFEQTCLSPTDGTDYIANEQVVTESELGVGAYKPIYVGEETINGTVYQVGLVCYGAVKDLEAAFFNDNEVDLTSHPDWLTYKKTSAWSAAGFTTNYVTRNSKRYTLIFLKGEAGEVLAGITPASEGSPGITLNVWGIEDVGDGTGDLITSSAQIAKHFAVNFLAPDTPVTGNWLTVCPTFPHPELTGLTLVNEDSFDTAETGMGERVSGGYEGAGVIGADGELVSALDALAQIAVSGDFDLVFNRKGQLSASIEPFEANATPRPITSVLNINESSFSLKDDVLGAFFNILPYKHTRDYAGRVDGGWKGDGDVRSDISIDRYEQERESPTFELHFIRTDSTQGQATFDDVMGRKLARFRDPMRLVRLTVPFSGLSYEVGESHPVTHEEGVGASGWDGHEIRITGHEVEPTDGKVHMDGYDLEALFAGISRWAEESTPDWTSADEDERKTYGFWADDDSSTYSDGEPVKAWQ